MDVGSIKNPTGLGSALGVANQSGSQAAQGAGASDVSAGSAANTQSAEQLELLGSNQEASREQLEGAVSTIQKFVQSVRRDIDFSVEDGNGRVVVKVTDSNSGDVIRQLPSEEALKLAENLSEVRSLLFKAEA